MFCRIIPSSTRTAPVNTSPPLINTAQPRPQASANSRQLPSLPLSMRQLPIVEDSDLMEQYFDVESTENEDELLSARFTRPGELFYYQTSSSSSSNANNSSSSENSDDENIEEQFPNENLEEEEEEGEVDEDNNDEPRIDPQLKSDEDDDQTSPNESEP